MKRKLFSDKDGTTFKEDMHDITEEVKAFFVHVPYDIKRLLPDAEDFVNAAEHLAEMVKEGGEVDAIIDNILADIPGTTDEVIYAKARDLFVSAVIKMRIALDKAEQIGAIKRDTVIQLLQFENFATVKEAALAIEMVLFAQK